MIKNIAYILFLITLPLFGFHLEETNINVEFGKSVTLKNSKIKIIFDVNMYSTLYLEKDGKYLSLNKTVQNDTARVPSFYLVTEMGTAKQFKIDFDKIKTEDITNEFGEGERIVLKGISNDIPNYPIQKILTVELYKDFPNSPIMYVAYKNLSSKNISLQEVFSNAYQLDATNVNKKLLPYSFFSFYGTEGRIYRQTEKLISQHFEKQNFTGRPDSLEGIKRGNGGIPVVDIWCKETGIGIGHIEKKWKNLYLPISVQKNGKVFIAIKEVPGINLLKPFVLRSGESFSSIKTFVNLHTLDFYNTVYTFSELMKREGIDFSTPQSNNDYLASWCTWNDYGTHARASKKDVMVIESVYNRLEQLKKLGIKEVIFDAGWFNNQGDWMPNNDSLTFPNGEKDIISAIKKIHQEGLKVELWLSFLTADPWSDIAKTHPEWMIKKTDASFHMDRWSGYTMCPSLPEVQEFHKNLANRLVQKYGADGFKVDGMYVCPPCYNPLHHHKNPNESSEDFHKVFKAFYDAAKIANKETSIMACPCGSVCDYLSLPYITQTIASDPGTFKTVRRKAKIYRALKGSNTPYSSDYIDHNLGDEKFPLGFVNAVGVGAVPQAFYGRTPSVDRLKLYRKWSKIYSSEKLYKAEYLDLYDMEFDKPETYSFKKNKNNKEILYYSFYAYDIGWNGEVEFRGLDKNKEYIVFDYVNNKNYGVLAGNLPKMEISFDNYLFVKCTEK